MKNIKRFRVWLLSCLIFALATFAPTIIAQNEPPGAIPFDSRWRFPQFVNDRPANGVEPAVNPPRFSWAYVHGGRPAGRDRTVPIETFEFQIARDRGFRRIVVNQKTNLNFYNALKPLAPGTYYWRVGYQKTRQSSPIYSFTITKDTPKWDRSDLGEMIRDLGRAKRSRMGPARGQWRNWAARLQKDSTTSWAYSRLITWADQAIAKPWYTDGLPASDKKTGREKNRQELLVFYRIAQQMTYVTMAYKLTGDKKYGKIKDRLLELAKYPKGGLSSPEGHGSSIKFTTVITTYMAICYDYLYEDLNRRERKQIVDSIVWRLEVALLDFPNWAAKGGTEMLAMGVSMRVSSHPYQNVMWLIPAGLIMAGEDKRVDALLETMMHFMIGVTGGAGWDEGWNEGQGYGIEKPGTMLEAALFTKLLMPDLKIELNPFFKGYGEWMLHLHQLGVDRMPFGDMGGGTLESFIRLNGLGSGTNAFMLAHLLNDGRYTHRSLMGRQYVIQTTEARGYTYLIHQPWLLFMLRARLEEPRPVEDEAKTRAFKESGWVMVSSEKPSDWKKFDQATGMLFQARPRGGYSHSYRSDGTFVWYAYGETLSAGGGTMLKMNPHTAKSITHNIVLVNGHGHEYNVTTLALKKPYIARLVAYREEKGYVHWVAEMTNGFKDDVGLKRWLRHVVFVDEKWFVIYDDLEMSRGTARFSWRFNVNPDVKMQLDQKIGGFTYVQGNVQAEVVFTNAGKDIEIKNMYKREGYKNPITGEDHYESMVKYMGGRANDPRWSFMDASNNAIVKWTPAHNIWVTNKRPMKKWHFMAALVATSKTARGRGAMIKVLDESTIQVQPAGGKKQIVSFNPGTAKKTRADIVIDPEVYARYADRTRLTE